MAYRELILGSGHRGKNITKLWFPEGLREWQDVTTLDVNQDCQPDVVHDLNEIPYPFEDNSFDEIFASEVLEHLGRQGDHVAFFAQFSEIHRIMKPDAYLVASVPRDDKLWAWGDPSHCRVINEGSITFLSQQQYIDQCGRTAMSDYRGIYKADFVPVVTHKDEFTFYFVLQAKK